MNIYGYAFTKEDIDDVVQLEALENAKCDHIYSDTCKKRAKRDDLFEIIKPGDTLIIWRLDRLVDSVKELQKSLTVLDGKRISLKTIQEKINHCFKDNELNELVNIMTKIESNTI